MAIGVLNSLALGRWHGFHGGLSHGDLAWLLIGAALVGVAIWALARRRRRWGWKFRL